VAGRIYSAATLDAAVWGAELATGQGRGHVYRVEPTDAFVEEVTQWQNHPPEVLQHLLDMLEERNRSGVWEIDD
jgi:hypothetical protein